MFFLFLIMVNINSKCICYYFNYNPQNAQIFFKTTCQNYADFMKNVLNEDCELKTFSNYLYLPLKKVDYLFIVGEGCVEGLFLTHSDSTSEGYQTQSIYKWKDLANNLNATTAVIDACYPGYIFKYPHPNVTNLITTSYRENSWNILNKYEKNVSSFSEALRCKYESGYDCFISTFLTNPCTGNNINKCQGWIILKAMEKWGWNVYWYDWEFPSMGTCYMNGKPCLWR